MILYIYFKNNKNNVWINIFLYFLYFLYNSFIFILYFYKINFDISNIGEKSLLNNLLLIYIKLSDCSKNCCLFSIMKISNWFIDEMQPNLFNIDYFSNESPLLNVICNQLIY